jgi:hypothetical protein
MCPFRRFACAAIVAAASLFGTTCGHHSSPAAPTDCTATVTPDHFTFDAAGGNGSVTVTLPSTCRWIAQSTASWLQVTLGPPRTGSGTVALAVSANAGEQDRIATATNAGQTVAGTHHGVAPQPPARCTYTIAPETASYDWLGGTGTIAVTAPATCAWTAAVQTSWLSFSGASQGSGAGTLSYRVDTNPSTGTRSGAISVADKTMTVTETGNLAACTYAVTPVEFTPCMAAVELSATLNTQTSCPWTAAPNANWMTLLSDAAGTGSALIRFSIGSNYDAPRSGVLQVRWPTPSAGQNLHVAQAGCHYAVSVDTIAVPAAGGTFGFNVYQESEPNTCGGPLQDACVWSAVADASWVTITSSMPRRGDDRVSLTVASNSGAARTSNIVVRDHVVRVTQAAP